MNKDIKFIINKVKEYSKISSLSGNEGKFLEYLKSDFPTDNHLLEEHPDCLFYKYKKPSGWLILCHVDRIPVPKFKFEIIDRTLVKGQLDNVISIAILRLLVVENIPVNILFTTQEETLKSCPQIVNISYGKNYSVLELDIDVATSKDEVIEGSISLRDRDNSAEFDKELVAYMKKICDRNNIRYITKDGDWLVDELGCTLAGVPSIKGCYVGVPIWEYHSNKEIVNIKCIENAIKLFECIKKEVPDNECKNIKNFIS